ncbi:MAG: TIGR03619 family F420-dependent LLM class oxidoreductase [Actinomycetota bacterium]|nr:TIGR03619 family F420-dependent LLM class oxidoreductase [Actinomycetota bacterium]
MRIGVALRSMGQASRPDLLLACARAAEAAGMADVWVQDHVAIPPDDAEGSEGRYLDPLTALAWLAGATERIGLGTGVLILPYRPALPTAKAIATVQELSSGRLRLGVGVGWMQPEFDALGVPRSERGQRSDAVLDLLARGFGAEDDVVVEHDQPFLFRPNPPSPPIYVGGHGEHAFTRAARYGDGWFPMPRSRQDLVDGIARLRERFAEAGRGEPEVVTFGAVPADDPKAGRAQLDELAELGVTGLIAGGGRYDDLDGFRRTLDAVVAARDA